MKKGISWMMAILLLLGTLSGCSPTTNEPQKSEVPNTPSNQESAAGQGAEAPVYPMDGTVTITINKEAVDLTNVPDYALDHYYWTQLQENTGIQIEFVGAQSGPFETTQEFLLLLASGEYPDIFQANWVSFPGGPAAALNDGYIQTLDQYSEYLPNLMQYLAENPDVDKMIRSDEGQIYASPWLREKGTEVGTGLIIRKDWLDQVNMEVPVTMDEMHDVLVAFKDQLGVLTPLTFELRWLWLETAAASLSNAFDVVYPYYIDENKVKFGPFEDGYKEFVTTMASWYTEGLLDTDLAAVDKKTVQAKFANSEAGVAIQQMNNVQSCVDAMALSDPSAKIVAVSSLVRNKGDKPKFSHFWKVFDGGFEMALTTQCKNVEVACRFMDYLYRKEGINLTAYGTEGVSYEADENGNFVKFTDLVLNNPNGDTPSTVRGYFAQPSNWTYPSRDLNYFVSDELKEVLKTWTADMSEHVLPPITHTTEESSIVSQKYSEIDTYCREMITKFILGTENLENWDKFIEAIKKLGAEEVLQLKQVAYDRYLAR